MTNAKPKGSSLFDGMSLKPVSPQGATPQTDPRPRDHASPLPEHPDDIVAMGSRAYRWESDSTSVRDSREETQDATPTHDANGIPLNDEQKKLCRLAREGVSLTYMGGAGTGKTTGAMPMIAERLENTPHQYMEHATLANDTPAVIVCAYTNAAINNIKRRAPKGSQHHFMTVHKALEATMEIKTVITPEGELESRMETVFRRDAENPLEGLKVLILEEATLCPIDLWLSLWLALPDDCQLILIGDLNQQRPPFGRSALEYYATRLPSVLLTKTYRQEGESPVTPFLQTIMKGKAQVTPEGFKSKYQGANDNGILSIQHFSKKIVKEALIDAWEKGMMVENYLKTFKWEQYKDVMLCPFNKSLGTVVINKAWNSYYSKLNSHPTHEIVSGFAYVYWAVGDYVLFNKKQCIIEEIKPKAGHRGLSYRPAEVGMPREPLEREVAVSDLEDGSKFAPSDDTRSERINAERSVSHSMTLYNPEEDKTFTISTQGDISSLEGAHCITSYKAQGLQWHRVFLFIHCSHNSMLSREMLYTMASRTEHSLHIMCERDTFDKGIKKQEIVGDDLETKLDWLYANPVPELELLFEERLAKEEESRIDETTLNAPSGDIAHEA